MTHASPRGTADLHVHTTHSDGALTPAQTVQAAANLGLAALAITDHDATSGLVSAREEGRRLGVEVVNGIEFSAEWDGREIHLLGYFFRDDHNDLAEQASAVREARAQRAREIASRLTRAGFQVDYQQVRQTFPNAALGRRHFAEWLFRSKQTPSVREAFDRYLSDDRMAGLPQHRLDWRIAITVIRESGGVAALAHPPYYWKEAWLRDLIDGGMQAIEVRGPGISRSKEPRLRGWAEKFDLVPVAGSDFHDYDRVGRWLGAISTPAADMERLRRLSSAFSS